MSPEEAKYRIPRSEIVYSTSRSAGPGGQNVNKVNTKVELRFNVLKSQCLSENDKRRILSLLKKRITSEGELFITSQSERSQLMNKKKVEERFYKLLASALTEKPERRSTKPTKASKTKRLEKKKKRGSVKRLRKDSGIRDEE
jgi:ribosome-associated protein